MHDIWENLGPDPDRLLLHGTAVALNGNAVLLLGPSGCGKSSTALDLMALGCDLVSDDRTYLAADNGVLQVKTPDPVAGLIEAWGFGLLPAPFAGAARLQFVVDMSREGDDRFPALNVIRVLQIPVRLYVNGKTHGLTSALYHLLRHGPFDDPSS